LFTLSKKLLNVDTRIEAAGQIIASVPESTSWIVKWTPDTHTMFPPVFKQRVITFMLCATQNVYLRLLPVNLLYSIIEFCQPCRLRMANNLEYFGWNLVQVQCDTSWILNKMLSLPIKYQQEVIDLFNDYEYSIPTEKVIDIHQFVSRIVHMECYITSVTEIKEKGLKIKFDFKKPVYENIITEYVLRTTDQKVLGLFSYNRMIYLKRANRTNHEHSFTELQWEYEKHTGRFVIADSEQIRKFKRMNTNFRTLTAKSISKKKNTVFLAKPHTIELWESSHQLVKFEYNEISYSGIVVDFICE
jgi:hypothetical protein